MKHDHLLIIFIKNPVPGKVKTRLAKAIGEQKAFEIYQQLLQHTHKVTHKLTMDKAVFYSDAVETGDIWDNGNYQKFVQEGSDLGKRMLNAFKAASAKIP
jgi:glycosyltransferase A (GT-A) superfamily protein (DUF2064 family)